MVSNIGASASFAGSLRAKNLKPVKSIQQGRRRRWPREWRHAVRVFYLASILRRKFIDELTTPQTSSSSKVRPSCPSVPPPLSTTALIDGARSMPLEPVPHDTYATTTNWIPPIPGSHPSHSAHTEHTTSQHSTTRCCHHVFHNGLPLSSLSFKKVALYRSQQFYSRKVETSLCSYCSSIQAI